MSQPQYALAWDSYKTNICSGFTALQQNGELVDMTLAADGHFVKVHQLLVALSSTYLKKLISSAPCQHPVIFLNNVSHSVLCYLLEYIYTGEVLVPSESLLSFTEAAKSLQIKGLEDINNLDQTARGNTAVVSVVDNLEIGNVNSTKRKARADIDEINLPSHAKKVYVKPEGAHMSVNQSMSTTTDYNDYDAGLMDDSGAQHSDDDFKPDKEPEPVSDMDQIKADPSNLLYTVSIRGSLQVILNRYIYNLNSTTTRRGVRKWRCVDYRNNKCNAFVVTKGNMVVNRANLHNHPFHDKKILAKIEKKAVFSHLDDVEAYKARTKELDDAAATTLEDEDDFSLENFKKSQL